MMFEETNLNGIKPTQCWKYVNFRVQPYLFFFAKQFILSFSTSQAKGKKVVIFLSPLATTARKFDTDLLPTRHLGRAPIRHCTLISTKTYTEVPDEQMKRTKKERKKERKKNIQSDQPA
jgi:hypothetical protein